MKRAVIIIDIQNDYFEEGLYPQFNAKVALENNLNILEKANKCGDLIILIKHESEKGFLVKNTKGADIHDALKPYEGECIIVVKQHADAFLNTTLNSILNENKITEICLSGMMTQNCVTHTAISNSADEYNVIVIANACSAPTQMVHNVAIRALTDRVTVVESINDVYMK